MSTEPTASDRAVASVERLFPGLTLEQFFAQQWPDEMLFVKDDPARLEGLIGLPILREYHRLLELIKGDTANVMLNDAAGREISASFPSDRVLPLLQAGSSILMPDMSRVIEPLAAVARRMEQAAGFSFNSVYTAIHISPPGRGVSLHFDKYDVMVVMVKGRKRWTVSRTPVVEYPSDGYTVGTPLPEDIALAWPEQMGPVDSKYSPEDTEDFVLEPGTVLYVPRGHWHRTKALEESVSIQIEVYTPRWMELLLQKIRQRLMRHGRWRQPSLGGFQGEAHPSSARARGQLSTLLSSWVEDVGEITPEDLLGVKPALQSVDEVMQKMRETFRPEEAKDLKAIFQFRINGPAGKDFFIDVDGPALSIQEGAHPQPSVTLSMSTQDLLLITAAPSQAVPLALESRLRFFPQDLDLLGRIFTIFGMFS